MTPLRLRRLAAVLLVVSGVLLLVGRAAEDDSHDESTEAIDAHNESDGAEETESEEAEHSETAGSAGAEEGEHSEEAEETLLGVDVESPLAIAGAMVVSLLLAAGLLTSRARLFAMATVGIGLAFAVFDIAEMARQVDESQSGIAVLAGLVALGHLVAAGAAGLSLRVGNPDGAGPR